jgi:hypothetical protein
MLLRSLLVWFVLVAVPFQGFAAAAMRCAHGVAGAASSASQGPDATPPCHQGAAQAGAPDDGAQAQDKKCGNCAACSVGAAIAPAASAAAPDCCPCSRCPSGAAGRIALADPDLPERPPRPLLA